MKSFRASVEYILGATIGAALCLTVAFVADPVRAQECPGNPDALGTSRTLVLQPGEFTRLGSMQYRQSLPLADKEVVLTFDDGPVPPFSTQVLDILAQQCVKVTYFLIGHQAHEYPAVARRMYDEGHTIGTHTEDHPLRMKKLPIDKARWEIDQGIADVAAALGDPAKLAPFFRVPGLMRTDAIEEEASARSLVVFSTDVVADDWYRRIKPKDIVARAMKRLGERGKGILLLHDIHPATVLALPDLLHELKENGFRIVHVVPASAALPAEMAGAPPSTAEAAPQASTDRSDLDWPQAATEEADDLIALPAPDARSLAADYRPERKIIVADRSSGRAFPALVRMTEWPDSSAATVPANQTELPAPRPEDLSLWEWRGREEAPLLPLGH
jgi:peptidoglycan-N-acetylglucosamine deacetylase